MKLLKIMAAFSLVASLAAPAWGHGAHVHGVATMNIAVDGKNVSIELESPLANLLSFEHRPENDTQRAEVRAMAAVLHDAGKVVVLPKAAECRVESIELDSDNIDDALLAADSPAAKHKHDDGDKHGHKHDDGDKHGHKHDDAHGDLDAEYSFICEKPDALDSLEIVLFSSFPNLHEIEAQIVSPKGQKAAELKAGSARVNF